MSKHVRLIDSDNLRGRDLTRAQVAKIRTAIEACLVLDGNGKTVAWAECLDADGDIVIDEVAYETAVELSWRR